MVWIFLVSEFLWFFFVPTVSEGSYRENSGKKGLFGGHGHWERKVLVVKLNLFRISFFFFFLIFYVVPILNVMNFDTRKIFCWISKQLSGASFGRRKDWSRCESAYFLDARSGKSVFVDWHILIIVVSFSLQDWKHFGFLLIRLWLWNNGASKPSFLEALRPIRRSRQKPRVVISTSCLWLRKRHAWFPRGNPLHYIYQFGNDLGAPCFKLLFLDTSCNGWAFFRMNISKASRDGRLES